MVGGLFIFLLICFLFGIASAMKGSAKGSSGWMWFLIGSSVPLFGFLAALAYPDRTEEPMRRCDGCGRALPISDTTCMRCGTDLDFPDQAVTPR